MVPEEAGAAGSKGDPAAATGPVVVGRQVWKVYGAGDTEVAALRGIDISIERGEIFLEGTDLKSMDDRTKSRYRARRVGFVFQSYNLLPVLSAIENVELPLLIAGVAGREARASARAILTDLGLGDRLAHRPSELSGGQQQRVSLARALVGRPAIVWADEPTGNLDEEDSRQVTRLLRELNRKYRQTIVIVTHDPTVAAACDRTRRMRDGQFVS